MAIERWPIALRADLVHAFRPGEDASKEAPFRTLRNHHWSTHGVSLRARRGGHANGRLTIFSILNLDAAWSARCGDDATAVALAKAAAKLENSIAFGRLKELLSSCSAEVASSFVAGVVSEPGSELMALIRLVAQEAHDARVKHAKLKAPVVWAVGRVSEAGASFVVVSIPEGETIAVPRGLASAVHRDKIGDCLALLTDQIDPRGMVVRAAPAIDLAATNEQKAFSPYGRAHSVNRITKSDAKMLRGTPAALKIRVPVRIEQ